MAPDSNNHDFNATSDYGDSDHSNLMFFDADEIDLRIGSLLHDIRSNYKNWNVGQNVDAFSEAGMLLIKHPPLEPLDNQIYFDALLVGFNSALYMIRGILLQDDMPLPSDLMSVQRSFVHIIVLAAYAKQGGLLVSAATALYEEVFKPFANWDRYDEGGMFYHPSYAMVIDFLMKFCFQVGLQEMAEPKDSPPTNEEVEEIVKLASNVFVSSPSGTGTRWLQDYMRCHRGASWLTDEELTIHEEE